MEVGSFSSFVPGKGAGRYLLNITIKILTLHNYAYIVLTTTLQVRLILKSLVCELYAFHPKIEYGSLTIKYGKFHKLRFYQVYCLEAPINLC